MSDIPLGIYRHYKSNEYEVIGFAKHSETLDDMVIYRALYGERGTWVLPLSMWDNEFIKRAVNKGLGDIVRITLEKDTKKREVIIPGYIEEALKNAGTLELFLEQADYAKREQINHSRSLLTVGG